MAWVALIFIIAASIFLGLYYNTYLFKISSLKKNELTPISQVKSGDVVRISGKIQYLSQLLTSPLTHRQCAYYNLTLTFERNLALKVERTQDIHQASIRPFVVKDETGYALLQFEKDFQNTLFMLDHDVAYGLNTINEIPDEVIEYMKLNNLNISDYTGIVRKLHFAEQILKDTDQITVYGLGIWYDTKELGLDLPVEKVLVLKHDFSTDLVVSDKKLEK